MSQYAKDIRSFLASKEQDTPDAENSPQETEQSQGNVIHVYHTPEGGVILSSVELDDEEQPPIVDAEKPAPQPANAPPPFLVFCFLLVLFVLLDVADNQLITLMTPTVTIAVTPSVKTISVESTAALGKLLSPLTVSESQTVATTGQGHQNAQIATGVLTFYNGLSTNQTVPAETVFTGQDGVQVTVHQTVTIPAALPPQFGETTVPATATNPGTAGNIAAFDISIALSNSLSVKNLAAFTGGRDHRDFQIVTGGDISTAAQTLKAKVTSSMNAALQGQLLPDQELQPTPCHPTVTADHSVGDEANTVTVTVSEMCSAIAYDTTALKSTAMQLLTTKGATAGNGYTLYGDIEVHIIKATAQNNTVILSFAAYGTYLYQLTAKAQERLKTLVAGKPRLTALHLLSTVPGIDRATISGINDNDQLPDAIYIHLFIILLP